MNNRTYLAMILALVIPGAGHFYLGKRGRAVVFFVIVTFMFVMGLWLDGKLYVPQPGQPLTFLATFASMGAGAPYFIARLIGPFSGDPRSFTFEYGTAFSLSAGLMNLLLVLDSFDIAQGRKG
jgi:TM2 domain-containing membrane protein YozV